MNSSWSVLAYSVVWGVGIAEAAVQASTEVALRLYALLIERPVASAEEFPHFCRVDAPGFPNLPPWRRALEDSACAKT